MCKIKIKIKINVHKISKSNCFFLCFIKELLYFIKEADKIGWME